ncbi:hypothetical protein QF037_002812 [Streptomyces canus]|uniref:hypothetical protein n=1 Tax=Streptomyces canus TaxID=58343 RepID=UPI00278675CB|nr:hypothetical protein [Streptomyces canus]MDQ0598467.1 hypothetical protein [Streptomyces canus]
MSSATPRASVPVTRAGPATLRSQEPDADGGAERGLNHPPDRVLVPPEQGGEPQEQREDQDCLRGKTAVEQALEGAHGTYLLEVDEIPLSLPNTPPGRAY